MSDRKGEPVEIGVVARAHGIRGELRVHLHNPDSTALDAAESIVIGGDVFAVASVRPVNRAVLVRVDGVTDRNAAEGLKGAVVAVERDELGLADDDVLLVDLVGLDAVLPDGGVWGRVVRIEHGPQDRLVVETKAGERQLPIVDAFVGEVDLEAKTIAVDPPEDLPE